MDSFTCSRCEEEHPIDFRSQYGFEEPLYEVDLEEEEEEMVYYENCYNCDASAVAGISVNSSNGLADEDDLPF